MVRTLQACAVVCGTLGLIFLVVAMATSSWMRGCLSMDKLMHSVSAMSGESSSPTNDNVMKMLQGQSMCFETGLFQLSVSLGSFINYKMSISFNSMDHFIQATSGLLIVGVILLVPAIILVALGTCSDSISEQRKNSAQTYTRIGCMIFVVGALVIGAGSLTYTIPQGKTVHNPVRFMQQIYVTMYKGFSEMMSKGGGSAMNMNQMFGFPQDQADGSFPHEYSMPDLESLSKSNGHENNVDIPGVGNPGASSELHGMAKRQSGDSDYSSSKPVHGYMPEQESMSSNSNVQMQQAIMMEVLKELDPMYGYSFFMVWLSFVLVLLAAVITAQAYRSMRRYNTDTHRVPML